MLHRTLRTRRITTLLLLPLAVACHDRAPTALDSFQPQPVQQPRLQNVATSELLTMGWLQPFGTTAATAPHDETLRPQISICLWQNGSCTGEPVARFSVDNGLIATSSSFSANWRLIAPGIPLVRSIFRISVTQNGVFVGVPQFVEVMRGRWALVVPGQTGTLRPASVLTLSFRLGAPVTAPPPVATVTAGVESATSQFLPGAGDSDNVTRTTQQTTSLATLGSALTTLQTSLSGDADIALTAFSKARNAAEAAVAVADPGDLAELDVIRLELDQVALLLGVSG